MDVASVTSGVVPNVSRPQASSAAASSAGSTSSTQAGGSPRIKPLYVTVEPDGIPDTTFRTRLEDALTGFFEKVSDDAETRARDVLSAIDGALTDAETKGEAFSVQIRITSIKTEVDGGDGNGAFASVSQLGLEVGVVRDGKAAPEDTKLFDFGGKAIDLSTEQIRAGLNGGDFVRQEAPSTALPERVRERLEAAQAGLARVRAVNDALGAYRREGNLEPLRQILEDGKIPGLDAFQSSGRTALGSGTVGSSAGGFGSLGQVFPGIGALSFDQ